MNPPERTRTPSQLAFLLHGIPITFEMEDRRLEARLRQLWAPFSASADRAPTEHAPIHLRLEVAGQTPMPPSWPLISQGPGVAYYRQGDHLSVRARRWGCYSIDVQAGVVSGVITTAGLQADGAFEDLLLLALAPLMRDRGLYPLHAFAAALNGRAIVLAGDIGAGKTTTGLSLLCQGARLLSNDSPLLRMNGDGSVLVGAYPGLLSLYPDSLAWFPELAASLTASSQTYPGAKIHLPAESIRPDIWRLTADPGLLLFPRVEPDLGRSSLRPISSFQALQRLAGQAIERWDRAAIPEHLQALRRLASAAPAYDLALAPDIERIPSLLFEALERA